jgi:hypothetical protein
LQANHSELSRSCVHNELTLGGYRWNGSNLTFGVEFPIHYKEGTPFDVSLDDLKFTIPEVDPGSILKDLIAEIEHQLARKLADFRRKQTEAVLQAAPLRL